MNGTLIWQLAWRYLRGKRAANVTPLLSRISMVAIAVSSAAMIIVFSVFNGLEGFVKDLYKGFYPDIKITAAKGKFFRPEEAIMARIKSIEGVGQLTTVLEDNVIVNSELTGEQKIAWVKGIDPRYLEVNNITDYITGDVSVSAENPHTAIAGFRILNELGVDINNVFSTVEMWYGNPDNTNFVANPEDAYRRLRVHPSGLFRISDEFDDKYILASLPLVQQLFSAGGKISSIEMRIDPRKEDAIKAALQKVLGADYKVETRYEQNKAMFTVMTSEKWVIYAILVMVLLVSSFNMVGALSVLVMEKTKDIAILRAMGADQATVRSIFITEGVLWSLTGAVGGILIGVTFCLLQMKFGFMKIGGAFMIDAYPVEMHLFDFVLVVITVMCVGILAAWYPAAKSVRTNAPTLRAS